MASIAAALDMSIDSDTQEPNLSVADPLDSMLDNMQIGTMFAYPLPTGMPVTIHLQVTDRVPESGTWHFHLESEAGWGFDEWMTRAQLRTAVAQRHMWVVHMVSEPPGPQPNTGFVADAGSFDPIPDEPPMDDGADSDYTMSY